MKEFLRPMLSLVLFFGFVSGLILLPVLSSAGSNYVQKDTLTSKDVRPYIDKMVSGSGDRLLKIERIARSLHKTIVFFRYYSRYGHASNMQIVFERKEDGRWYNASRKDYLTEE